MRKPFDLDAELKALEEKATQLKTDHRAQLVELLERTKADRLPVDLLAGALLEAVTHHDAGDATAQDWSRKGAGFFRPTARPRRPAATPGPPLAGTTETSPPA
ncbi:conjugal transfer protein TraD [Marinivivus vitaminiproducens]|uniref:conjugal transfer protein TraD n=1 Tax=Marinivivus vitaminiproducens TaxID=3035935 RepID=UPI0027988AA2|nr:conjugal transfer protein TraD [Geminicoccaceae bacterium SCSIO 64248]